MRKIGLHGLFILIGPSCAGKSTFITNNNLQHEVVSSDALRVEFTGDMARQDRNEEIFEIFRDRIMQKLAFGQRVFADATHLRDSDRKHTASLGIAAGVPVTYVVFNRSVAAKLSTAGWREGVRIKGKSLIEAHEETFQANISKILKGDGNKDIAVIDTRTEMYEVVQKLPRDARKAIDALEDRYQGVCAIGDVHGNLYGATAAVAYAKNNYLFPIFLGDIVDYGEMTLICASYVAKLVFRGEALCIMGNHEKKIVKILKALRTPQGFTGSVSHGNDVTVNQLKAMDQTERMYWEEEFFSFVENCPNWQEIGDHLFTHGAATKSMFGKALWRAATKSLEESHSMFGETTGQVVNGFPERRYSWIDTEIPTGKTVVVGHAVRSWGDPLVVENATGGKAIFLDTGSSKADDRKSAEVNAPEPTNTQGRLSWLDLRFGKGDRLVDPTFHNETEFL
jgi:predicted kinase